MPSDPSFGWWVHLKTLLRSSNLRLYIPVIPCSFIAGIYFLFCETRDHSHTYDVVSDLVIKTMIPNDLKTSIVFISLFLLFLRFVFFFFLTIIDCNCSIENDRKLWWRFVHYNCWLHWNIWSIQFMSEQKLVSYYLSLV